MAGKGHERPPATKIAAMAAGRFAIGTAALLAPGPTSRLLGFPREQDSPTARLMGRLFGVRDIALGALAWRGRDEPEMSRYIYKLNAWVDAGDAATMGAALIGRRGIDRAALCSAAFALTGAAGWVTLMRASAAPSSECHDPAAEAEVVRHPP